jgi:hypothetical protein
MESALARHSRRARRPRSRPTRSAGDRLPHRLAHRRAMSVELRRRLGPPAATHCPSGCERVLAISGSQRQTGRTDRTGRQRARRLRAVFEPPPQHLPQPGREIPAGTRIRPSGHRPRIDGRRSGSSVAFDPRMGEGDAGRAPRCADGHRQPPPRRTRQRPDTPTSPGEDEGPSSQSSDRKLGRVTFILARLRRVDSCH